MNYARSSTVIVVFEIWIAVFLEGVGVEEEPVLVLVGPRGVGKTVARKYLVEILSYPKDRVFEGHVVKPQVLGRQEVWLGSNAAVENFRSKHPGCVFVWLEAFTNSRHSRMLAQVEAGERDADSVPDFAAFILQQREATLFEAKSSAQQVIYNTQTVQELYGHLRMLRRRCACGAYGILKPGESLARLGSWELPKRMKTVPANLVPNSKFL